MTRSRKHLNRFTQGAQLDSIEGTNYSHVLRKLKKLPPPNLDTTLPLIPKYEADWYAKMYHALSRTAKREVVAQELFRLFIPGQPKFRLADSDDKNLYVLSKEVPGFASLATIDPDTFNKNIFTGKFWGFGAVTLLSVVLNEIDLKFDNMGINTFTGQIIKLDGDWCFANVRESTASAPGCQNPKTARNYKITEALIRYLPLPFGYDAYNWVDAIISDVKGICILSLVGLADYPPLREEINFLILRLILFPQSLLRELVFFHAEDEREANFLMMTYCMRIADLKSSALINESFRAYVQTEDAARSMAEYITYLLQFKITGKNFLIKPSMHREIQFLFAQNFLKMQRESSEQLLSPHESDVHSVKQKEISNGKEEVGDSDFVDEQMSHLNSLSDGDMIRKLDAATKNMHKLKPEDISINQGANIAVEDAVLIISDKRKSSCIIT